MRLVVLTLLCFGLAGRPAMAGCGEDLSIAHALRVGLSLHVLFPNKLPGFMRNLLTYGVVVGVPVGPGSILAEMNYGADSGLTVFLTEANYRLWLRTPFLVPYFQGGFHYLKYSNAGQSWDGFGGNLGLGFVLSVERNFEITLGAAGYLRSSSVLAMGGGFNFRF